MGSGTSAQDYMVQQRIAGASMTVETTMPAGGGALVQGDSVSGQALYYVPVHSANFTEVIATNSSGNPRVDQVILEVLDNVHDAGGNNLARIRVVQGTGTASATLDNRLGAATLPGSALLLADVLVANAAASITNAVIRDRRKWSRGGQVLSHGNNGGDVTTASSSFSQVSLSAVASFRLECSGTTLEVAVNSSVSNSTAGAGVLLGLYEDSTELQRRLVTSPTAAAWGDSTVVRKYGPTAGSHVFTVQMAVQTSGTASLRNSTGDVPEFSVREVPAQNAANNSVTSG